MKILYYELMKLGKKRLFVFVAGVLFIACCFLYLYTEWQKQPEFIAERAHYEKLESKFREVEQGEGLTQTTEITSELKFFSLLSSEAVISTFNPEWKSQIDEQKRNHPEAVSRYLSSLYVNDEAALKRDLFIYEQLKNQYEVLKEHRAYILEIEERSADMLSASIFHKEHSFSYRNIHKTLEDFKPLQSIELQIGLEHGVVSATRFTPADLCMLILLFLLSFYLFHYEREAGHLRLIRSTQKGRWTTAAAKLSTLILMILFISILFYASILVIAYYLYGFGDVNRLIQSMPSFKNSTSVWTVGQYIGYYLLLKALACLFMGLLIAALFTVFRRPIAVFLLLLAFIGGSYFFYHQIHPNSYANGLKYLNPIAFMDIFHLIAEYRNINLFGYPFTKTMLSYVTGSSLILACVFLVFIGYSYQWSIPLQVNGHKLTGRIRSWFFRYRSHNFLFHHEWFKLLILGRGWLILLAAILLSVQMLNAPARSFTMDESIYNYYMSQLRGPLDDTNTSIIESERTRYAQLGAEHMEWEEKFKSGAISEEEYNEKQLEWVIFEKREKGFRIVEQQYLHLLPVKERTGLDVGMVNQLTSDQLFHQQSRDSIHAMLLLALLIPLLSSLFTQDYRNNSIILLRATQYGRGLLYRRKLYIAYSLVIFLFILIDLPKLLQMQWYYPEIDWSLPIQSIQLYSEISWLVTIKQYFWIMKLIQIMGCLLLVHISFLLSILVRRLALSLLLQGALYIVPLALAYLGYSHFVAYTFNGVFLAPYIFYSPQAATIAFTYMGSLAIIGAGAALLSWNKFGRTLARKE